MLAAKPTQEEILALSGQDAFTMWRAISHFISDNYSMDIIWDEGGKYGAYEQKFRKNGKTLTTLYIKEKELVVLITFGKLEREKFEEGRMEFSPQIQAIYDEANTYHDGKWMYIKAKDPHMLSGIIRMLVIKKKPNRRITMCGYVCDLCKAFAPNIERKDERDCLSALWRKYYDLDIPAESIYCEGCRNTKKNAVLLDSSCPVRACVLHNHVDNCSECSKFPCAVFQERKGLSFEEAKEEKGTLFDEEEYEEFMLAYDNKSRLDRRLLGCGEGRGDVHINQ